MTTIQFITTVLVLAVVGTVSLYLIKRRKDSLVELNCKFCLSENTDQLLDTYHEQTGAWIDGLLGNDFLVKNDYIIDYKNLMIRHNTKKISIKDAMDIVEMPLIVLYQGWRKYVFILDTGATTSLIHSKHLQNMRYEDIDNGETEIYGFGGQGSSSKTISTSLFYSKDKIKEPL